MIIELQNVSITNNAYLGVIANGHRILTNISLDIDQGELVYLIGKVGSGKSTLLKALYGEIPITRGRARIVGYNLKRIKKNQIPFMRRRMGIVLPDYHLLPDRNIYENMKYVLEATSNMSSPKIHHRVHEVLELVNLDNKFRKMPYELSSGEQQRATIARAFLNYPKLIIADEPTANLDSETSSEIMEIFVELSKMGSSVFLSTHDISIIEQYPFRTLKCENGSIEEIDVFSILGIEQKNETFEEEHKSDEELVNEELVNEEYYEYVEIDEEEDF